MEIITKLKPNSWVYRLYIFKKAVYNKKASAGYGRKQTAGAGGRIKEMANRNGRIVWRRISAIAAAALLALALGACKGQGEESSSGPEVSNVSENAVFPEGTQIGGVSIGGKTEEEALKIAEDLMKKTVDGLEISVAFKNDTVALKGDDFAIKDVLGLSIKEMLESGKAGSFELPFVSDLSQKGESKLSEAAKSCFQEGKDAAIEKFDTDAGQFVFTEEQAGSRVDMTATLRSVRQLLAQKRGGAIQAEFVESKPKITKKYLEENFKLLSTYSTVSTNNSNGNSNMALALSHVNGTILQPGQEFSYNGTIGDSTDPNGGWLPAGGLVGGVSVSVYGGGICQGSTTIYNAALMAGMEILERDCHAIPSSYCPIGLDATVDYGSIDFRFRNSLKNPVYIASWMDGVTLTVNFYGVFPEEWDNIELGSEQTGYEPPRDTVSFEVDGSLAKGQYVRTSSGNSGYYASAWRTFYKNGEAVRTEDLPNSYYGSTGKRYKVGPGTDTSKVDTSKESGSTEGSPSPSPKPTEKPTQEPTPVPPSVVTPEPTQEPTPEPTQEPSDDPTDEPPVDDGGGDTGE